MRSSDTTWGGAVQRLTGHGRRVADRRFLYEYHLQLQSNLAADLL